MKRENYSEVFDFDFANLDGPKSSAAANFEELVSQLLALEVDAEAIDGRGGDLGIDCYTGRFRGRLTAFQAKYFLGRLRRSQRDQIKRSFAVAAGLHKLDSWILCTPSNPSPREREWLDSLGASTEWWGETKLRSLLAKHPVVSKQFFKEPLIAVRLTSVEDELRRLRNELWPRVDSQLRTSAGAKRYLLDAKENCRAVLNDFELLYSEQKMPWVSIDFCDLYAYLRVDPSLLVRLPLIDYCLRHSPWPVILPPGTVYEIGTYVRRSPYHRWDAEEFLKRLRSTPEALAFTKEFDSDPTTSQAAKAYRAFVTRMRYYEVTDDPGTWRLVSSLRSGAIDAAPEEYRFLSQELFTRAIQYFTELRPMQSKSIPNRADAANMAFLHAPGDKQGIHSRMISSARSMGMVSRNLSTGKSLVRTPQQFALMLTVGRTRDEGQTRLCQACYDIERLLRIIEDRQGVLAYPSDVSLDLLPELRNFASTYREILRPVDDMLEDGFRAISRIPLSREHYELLAGEAAQVAAFRRLWERVSADYKMIDSTLREYHGYEDIADQIEACDT